MHSPMKSIFPLHFVLFGLASGEAAELSEWPSVGGDLANTR
jgi:hypothetical protein